MPADTTSTIKLLLTPDEAAKALAIHRSTLYGYLMSGEIASFSVGRARRIPVRALEEWIARQLGGEAPSPRGGAA
jgi:excisionase family DNA binding protein